MTRRIGYIVLVLLALLIVGALFVSPASAYVDSPDTRAIRGILSEYRSPLPWWTISAFKALHPDFDVAGYLAVAWVESSLGRNCGIATNNVGCIRGGPIGSVWRDLRAGTRAGYNLYRSTYDGQRGLIRLLWERGYNDQLRAHQWSAFTARYYGANVRGRTAYQHSLVTAHNIIVRKAAAYGVAW